MFLAILHFVRAIWFLLWQLHVVAKRSHRFASWTAKVATNEKEKRDIKNEKSAQFTTNTHACSMHATIGMGWGSHTCTTRCVQNKKLIRFDISFFVWSLEFFLGFVRGDPIEFSFFLCSSYVCRCVCVWMSWCAAAAFSISTEPRVCSLPFVYLVLRGGGLNGNIWFLRSMFPSTPSSVLACFECWKKFTNEFLWWLIQFFFSSFLYSFSPLPRCCSISQNSSNSLLNHWLLILFSRSLSDLIFTFVLSILIIFDSLSMQSK